MNWDWETLEETLSFLDEELPAPGAGITAPLASLSGEEWDPDELLTAMGNDIGDFRVETGASSVAGVMPETTSLSEETAFAGQGSKKQEKPKKRRKRKKQLNSNKARDDCRYEVVKLRREAEDLELTLKQLQAIRGQQGRDTDNRSVYAMDEDASGIPAVWQDICARQLDRRLKAERENVLLKKQCKEEKRLAKSIEKMLFKRMALRDVPHAETSKHTRRTTLPAEYIKRVAAFIFDELSASVEVSYREVEGIFAANSTIPRNVVTHQPLLRGGMKGMYRKLFDERVVPFTLQEVGDAWWQYWHSYRGQRIQDATSNVVTESFGLEMTDLKSNASATSYGQQILRRHVEENRIVFVWNAYIEPFVFENESISGVYLLEQSHVLIKPEEQGSTLDKDKKKCSTSMSTCYVITPHFLDPELKTDPKTVTLIDFLVSALSANITMRNESVENMLLDQALQSSVA